MLNFREIKSLIVKNCRVVDNTSIDNRFGFTIDASKFEKSLNEKSDLHLISFAPVIESRVPNITEIQSLSEYIHKKIEIDTVFDGATNIATFMLYCDKEGACKLNDAEGNPYTSQQIFDILNSDQETDKQIAKDIVETFPVYRVLVIKRFNRRTEKFIYSIYFRSNYNMITYIKTLDFSNDNQTINEKKETATPLVEAVGVEDDSVEEETPNAEKEAEGNEE